MKIYSYFVCKVLGEDKKSFEIKKIKLSNEVIEHPGCYSQVDEKNFYTNWSDCWKNSNFLSKDSIGKVLCQIYGTNVIYGTYLLEDNEKKAFNQIIAEKCQKDIEELKQKMEELMDIYKTICSDSVYT